MSTSRALFCALISSLGVLGCAARSQPTAAPPPSPSKAGPPDAGCKEELPAEPKASPFALRFDQVGYSKRSAPWAVLMGSGQPAPGYRIVDAKTGCRVGQGTAGPRVLATTSRAGTPLTADRVDLTKIPAPGSYLVVLDDGARFGPIELGARLAGDSLARLVRFFRVQRCGPTTAAVSLHGACHLHASISDGDPATLSGDGIAINDGYKGPVKDGVGPVVDAEGGWHDAGDFIKFVGTTSFTLATHLLTLRDHRPALERVMGAQTVSDFRAEMRWGLDWLVKMVGGPELYHQVSGEPDHKAPFRSPENDTKTIAPPYTHRPVIRMAKGRGANLLGRSAAALALGAQVFADDPAYAARLLDAAKKAYAAGKQRPQPQNPNPADFYREESVRDDQALGAAVLARVTGEPAYRDEALAHARAMTIEPGSAVSWGHVDSLAFLETALLFPADSPERAELARGLAAMAAPTEATVSAPRGPGAPYHYALPDFSIDSLADALGAAATCLAARRLGGHDPCVAVAHNQLHFLWGQNPFGLSFQIGMGQHFPKHPHHAFSAPTGAFLDGAVLGGPTHMRPFGRDKKVPVPNAQSQYARWSTNDLVYDDHEENWLTNEPALDFTAGLVWVLGELAELE